MANYYFENNGFAIDGFDTAAPFCSFLPGLAGMKGVPIWSFYVNRGQGICSFGIEHKDNSIMEFAPANTAYRRVSREGFRTFIKTASYSYEPFAVSAQSPETKRTMRIYANSFSIEEKNNDLHFAASYYVLPNENFPALVRSCALTNTSDKPQNLSVLDGLTEIIPFGVSTGSYKAMSNLNKSWAHQTGLETGVPFFHTRSIPSDNAEVLEQNGGYFYLSFVNDGAPVRPVIDPALIFGTDTAYAFPQTFPQAPESQTFANKFACAFTPLEITLAPGETVKWNTLIGFAADIPAFHARIPALCQNAWLATKEREAAIEAEKITDAISAQTALPLFDGYLRQSYLDNVLRGGLPVILNEDKIIHLFSRKHGDPERDYNFFSIAAEYFSQGNGNFRDVCQNRRNDVLFNPEIGDFNIKTFFSLIQADGFNPLEVRGSTFSILPGKEGEFDSLLQNVKNAEPLRVLCQKPFTAGMVINTIFRKNIIPATSDMQLLNDILALCRQNIEAVYGEGYWIDHWTYLMDLVDSYLAVYPDRKYDLLFKNNTYRYFVSPVRIRPRREAYVLKNGKLRQYAALQHLDGKPAADWLKTKDGTIYETNLMAKMISLATIKFASLDPIGCGLEMDGGRPGWNDAMNGLPGLFGSGVGESFELLRLINFILSADGYDSVKLPEEIAALLNQLHALQGMESGFEYWNTTAEIKEKFREGLLTGISGVETSFDSNSIADILTSFSERLQKGLEKAETLGDLIPTYLTFEPTGLDADNFPTGFECRPLPTFLEGPVRQMKTLHDTDKARDVFNKIKSSDLYDKVLKMYKTSVPLDDCGFEIGRIRAFTAGWLERESVFMHMTLKYLLELLKSGLYSEFCESVQTSLPPFLKPEIYGRSPLENCSFIASSVNPDPSVIGRGFVSRLTGSTSEVLSIFRLMFWGKDGFDLDGNGKLVFKLDPVLPDWIFTESGEAQFTLLGSIPVLYKNPSRKSTFGEGGAVVSGITVEYADGVKTFDGNSVTGQAALDIRNRSVKCITATLK